MPTKYITLYNPAALPIKTGDALQLHVMDDGSLLVTPYWTVEIVHRLLLGEALGKQPSLCCPRCARTLPRTRVPRGGVARGSTGLPRETSLHASG